MGVRNIFIRFLLFAFLSAVLVASAESKCALEPYKINGQIFEEQSQKPVEHAKVIVFFDDYESTSSDGYFTKYPDFFETKESGNFNATAWFDTYSGSGLFGGDRCNGQPKSVTIVVIAEGYRTKRKEFELKHVIVKGRTDNHIIELPPVEMLLPMKK